MRRSLFLAQCFMTLLFSAQYPMALLTLLRLLTQCPMALTAPLIISPMPNGLACFLSILCLCHACLIRECPINYIYTTGNVSNAKAN